MFPAEANKLFQQAHTLKEHVFAVDKNTLVSCFSKKHVYPYSLSVMRRLILLPK